MSEAQEIYDSAFKEGQAAVAEEIEKLKVERDGYMQQATEKQAELNHYMHYATHHPTCAKPESRLDHTAGASAIACTCGLDNYKK